jgi:hypothetical protein
MRLVLVVSSVLGLFATGCSDPVADCNLARVNAHDAWDRYARVTIAEMTVAQRSYAAEEPPARAARDEACRRARLAWSDAVARNPDGTLRQSAIAVVAATISTAMMAGVGGEATTDPCSDPRFATPNEREGLASGEIPRDVTDRRDAQIREAVARYEAVVAPLREAEHRHSLVAAALAVSTGSAIPARDAARAVLADTAHPEAAAASAAAEAAWEACREVDP